MDSMSLIMIVIIVAMMGFMWMSQRKQKQQQQEQNDWRRNLEKGDPIATFSGMVGTVEEIDEAREQIVINSNGYLSRWRFAAITQPPQIPDFVPDSEVDEDGNPLPGVEHVKPEAVPYVPLAVDALAEKLGVKDPEPEEGEENEDGDDAPAAIEATGTDTSADAPTEGDESH